MYQDYKNVCPKCGHELMYSVICTYPPIEVEECPNCQWRKEKTNLLNTTLQEGKARKTKMKSMSDIEKILLSHGLGSISGVTVMKIIDAIIESQLVDINLLRTNLMDVGLDHIQMDDGLEIIQVIDEIK